MAKPYMVLCSYCQTDLDLYTGGDVEPCGCDSARIERMTFLLNHCRPLLREIEAGASLCDLIDAELGEEADK